MTRIAIVTGASSGLGAECAQILDKKKSVDEIWLVARRRPQLEAVCHNFTHCRGRVFALDLNAKDEASTLYEAIAQEKPVVAWLINSAGFGKFGDMDQAPLATNLQMVHVNIVALVELTQRCLPYCQRGSKIVQVASTAGFLPIPGFALYAATKAFVVSLSQSLAIELKPRGITVTTVCPGPIDTEFTAIATNNTARPAARLFMAKAHAVARRAILDAEKGKSMSMYGLLAKLFVLIHGLIPKRLAGLVMAQFHD